MSRFLKYVSKAGLNLVVETDGLIDSLDWSEKKYCLPWDGLEFKWELYLKTARLKFDWEKADGGPTAALLLHFDQKLPEDRTSIYHRAVDHEYAWSMVMSRAVLVSKSNKEQMEEYLIQSWKLFWLYDRPGFQFDFLDYALLLKYNWYKMLYSFHVYNILDNSVHYSVLTKNV